MPDDRTHQESFYEGPLPRRMRLQSLLGGAPQLRRAELIERSRGADRMALSMVLRLSAARLSGLAVAEGGAAGAACALAAYRRAGLRCLALLQKAGE